MLRGASSVFWAVFNKKCACNQLLPRAFLSIIGFPDKIIGRYVKVNAYFPK